ncbi:2OG-Fe(II) oxygenase superfamily protein [Hirsutella rhossiliensis]|uniref:2OG-Fe(II) oxygenase superfamily domain-containing protein n=1 Tax=Hirsutella rhossiliensis TaxID=111463 RepID=A0A9P8N388_9HYPO|nr:2OG-Fe(II) oxygenase superfamily domain-containing protein [Hirsutella rhossiliensis]KAH0965812.1 2OG-Fe(II) oxygenase superfamily domain-containing protein [Hirsutella rhossiliensis]
MAEDGASQLTAPIVDISGYLADDAQAVPRIASSIASAAHSPGFFQITGHGISSSLVSRLLENVAAFFAFPYEVRYSVRSSKLTAFRGFEAMGDQRIDKELVDCKEGFMIGRETSPEDARYLQGPNQWPLGPQGQDFKHVMMEFHNKMLGLSKVMFSLVALSLGLKEDYFDAFVDTISMMRAHRYPPMTPETAKNSRGIGEHTDFGALTLLLQDQVGGLEVFHRPSKTWHAVEPVEGAFVVNIGDMLERWTNSHYTSTLHRDFWIK